MAFEIEGKVALVTGAASGIGFHCTMELLRNGAKAVTLADVNPDTGKEVLQKIEKEFGKGKAIFVKTDVSNYQEYEDAFKKTLDKFKNIDILINNAGIMADKIWEKEIAINVNGVVHGMLLGLENYLLKHKQGPEGIIVNMSSVAGLSGIPSFPVYVGTKFSVIGMTLAWGAPSHYDRTKVKVFAVCPGPTDTPLMNLMGKSLGEHYEKDLAAILEQIKNQDPENVVKEVLKLLDRAKSGSIWVVENNEPAYEYVPPDYQSFKK